jgi:cation:H+ antiporter
VKKDIPFSVLASVLLILLAFDHFMSRMDGIILLIGFAVFMAYTLMQAKKGSSEAVKESSPVWKNLLFLVFGLAGLVVGSNLFVDSASDVALTLGISEGVVGLTIVAGGTSLPELATSVVAARKGQSAIAIGNVIGSNVFNILLILGLTSTISPLEIEGITTIDMAVMLLSVVLVWLFSRTRYTVERWEGGLLVGLYFVYVGWLITSL